MNYKLLVEKLDECREYDENLQQKMDNFSHLIASASYSPVIEETQTKAFLKGVSTVLDNPELIDWIEYYIYEAPSVATTKRRLIEVDGKYQDAPKEDYGTCIVTSNNKEYDFAIKEEFIKFLEENY